MHFVVNSHRCCGGGSVGGWGGCTRARTWWCSQQNMCLKIQCKWIGKIAHINIKICQKLINLNSFIHWSLFLHTVLIFSHMDKDAKNINGFNPKILFRVVSWKNIFCSKLAWDIKYKCATILMGWGSIQSDKLVKY